MEQNNWTDYLYHNTSVNIRVIYNLLLFFNGWGEFELAIKSSVDSGDIYHCSVTP